MATYLMTGGCGFIGLHLCKALLRRGDAVRVLDNLSTGCLSNLPAASTLIEGDVADFPARVQGNGRGRRLLPRGGGFFGRVQQSRLARNPPYKPDRGEHCL
jgi:nucleoside-diphosphate-sugar epimerase